MFVKQLYTTCLSVASYYVECGNEVAIIDPMRDAEQYLKLAESRQVKITYILLTHFHADFVGGHVELADKCGAQIIMGPGAETDFAVNVLADGEELSLGSDKIRLLHTPGHTAESSSYLLMDESGTMHFLFSGDTLFMGDVGRPDLAVSKDCSREELAGTLFDSLNEKIKPLPDDIIIYPGHGPGSSCGRHMDSQLFDTLGAQKKSNYALRLDNRDAFISSLCKEIAPAPAYFEQAVLLNKSEICSLDEIQQRSYHAFGLEDFIEKSRDAQIIDARSEEEFAMSHIPGSLFLGHDEQLVQWAGLLDDVKRPLLLVCDEKDEQAVVTSLAQLGFNNVQGFLKGTFDAWDKSLLNHEKVELFSATHFFNEKASEYELIDVRSKEEFQQGHVSGARFMTLAALSQDLHLLDKNKKYCLYCAGGFRSMIAASILQRAGIRQVASIIGGYSEIEKVQVAS
ncbi:MAG: MBL fold metallo-hydrolase [Lentisphaeraceae bacterium]|nr:MBL fold metallo-hydrolase [Lentisphaeraceae bacterium]